MNNRASILCITSLLATVSTIAFAQVGTTYQNRKCVQRGPCAGQNDGAAPKCSGAGSCNWCDGTGFRNEECTESAPTSCTSNGLIADCGMNHNGNCELINGAWTCVDYGMFEPCFRYDCHTNPVSIP